MASKKTPAVKVKASELSQVQKWIISGASADDVAEAIRTTYPESDPAALMLGAMERFREASNFEPSIVLGFVFEGVREVYRKCNESGDYATALRALKQLEGLAKHVRNQANDGEQEPQAEDAEADDDRPHSLPITGAS